MTPRSSGRADASDLFRIKSTGRQLRSYARFGHTGEVFGLPGQTVAGLASAGGAVLVWTVFALAWRRFRAGLKRRREAVEPARECISEDPAA